MADERADGNQQNERRLQLRQLFRDVDQQDFEREHDFERIREQPNPFRHRNAPMQGLTVERVGKFQHFEAYESMVGQQCAVCLDDLEVGRKMVRLDCHVDHYFCQTCADDWFKKHDTCPTCRHKFESY